MRLPSNIFCEKIQKVGFEKLNDSIFNGYIKGVPVELYVKNYNDSIHCPSEVFIESEPYLNFDLLCQTITTFESYITFTAMPSWAINSTDLSNYIKLIE